LKPTERENQQLQEAQKAKSGRRASQAQEHKPSKANSQRRQQKVFVETNHKDHNILSFDAVRRIDCTSPAGCPQITTQLVLFSLIILFDEHI
jgi:hypothetical protein